MSEQMRNGKLRKILGSNGSSTGVLTTSNATLNLKHQQQIQNPASIYTNGGDCAKYSNHTFINTDTATLQQMDRLRLPLMGQDMHAIWPYGTITTLSPMMPAHMAALPLGALPYVPIYQSMGPQPCTSSPVSTSSSASSSAASQQQNLMQPASSSSRTSLPVATLSCGAGGSGSTSGGSTLTANQNSANDSNKINIQIGLQCVSQNNPMNFNSMNDSLAKVNLLNFNSGCEKDNKETPSSLRCSPILHSPDESAAGGDANNLIYNGVNDNAKNGATIVLSQAKFNELTRLALRGSEIAEKLAYTHRNRPCFKKIDSLCARMKQDLIRPDGVLPNINSQGIAWAVKDFIFVFTRVINAWIIIKGYVYNTPEGLNKVKAALSPDFAGSFAAWQDTTMDFIENLIKSFVNLDNLVQSQKNVYQKSDITLTRNSNPTTPIKVLPNVNTLLDESFDFLNNSSEKSQQNSLNKNYIYTMVEDSEGSQRQATVNGTYFKTGTYNPIKKDSLLTEQAPIVTTEQPVPHLLAAPLEQYFNEQLSGFWPSSAEIDTPATTATVTSGTTAEIEYLKSKEKIPSNWLNYDLRVLEQNFTEFCNDYDPNAPPRPLGKDLIDKLNIMIERLMSMKNADMFFKSQFTKNYFPDFLTKYKHEFMDIRSIIFKCQVGGYQSIFEMVHDVRKIIYSAKEFLKVSKHT